MKTIEQTDSQTIQSYVDKLHALVVCYAKTSAAETLVHASNPTGGHNLNALVFQETARYFETISRHLKKYLIARREETNRPSIDTVKK